jgi:hypothetical protein
VNNYQNEYTTRSENNIEDYNNGNSIGYNNIDNYYGYNDDYNNNIGNYHEYSFESKADDNLNLNGFGKIIKNEKKVYDIFIETNYNNNKKNTKKNENNVVGEDEINLNIKVIKDEKTELFTAKVEIKSKISILSSLILRTNCKFFDHIGKVYILYILYDICYILFMIYILVYIYMNSYFIH